MASSLSAAVEPGVEGAVALGLDHLQGRAAELGLEAEDVEGVRVTNAYRSRHNGVSHVYFRQTWLGLDVMNADGAVHVLPNGEVLVLHHRDLVRSLAARAGNARVAPALSAVDAVRSAAVTVGLPEPNDVLVLQPSFGPDSTTLLTSAVSDSEIPARLVWTIGEKGDLVLAWELSIDDSTRPDWWNVRVDASTGAPLEVHNWTNDLGGDGSSYKVFEVPVESPSHSTPSTPADGRTTANEPAHPTASPFGWHDTNGAAGAEFTTTEGNNVHAYTDVDNNNTPDAGSSPDGGAGLDFDFVMDLTQAPSTYRPAAVTNLFYWNNAIHDVAYLYGFDEASGNFQVNNYGNGGAGNDSVRAEAQDGSGTNNANFSTPADGQRPRMQMYVWTAPTPDRDGDFDAGIVAHEYYHGVSNRLTGGPANVSCLQNSEQMGEGWSDYGTLMFTTVIADGTVPHGVGTYALNQATNGPGIRAFPYSTNMAVDPRTYQDSRSAAVPHGVGSIWTAIIWEGYWALVAEHGFNPDVYGDWTTGGNNLFNQLVFDGMKLQPCSPGMVDGRDAILAADVALTGGANQCILWEAFAKRGLGANAIQGSSGSNADNTNGFEIPASCSFFGSPNPAAEICAGTDANYTVTLGSAFTPPVNLSATPPGSANIAFGTNPVNSVPGNSTVTVSNTGGLGAGDYTITVNGNDAAPSLNTFDLDLTVYSGAPPAPGLTAPANGSTDVPTKPTLSWTAAAGAAEYLVEVATDAGFGNIVASTTVTGTSHQLAGNLAADTEHFWRVTPANPCASGAVSTVFSFTTVNLICDSPSLAIPDSPGAAVFDEMVLGSGGSLTDLNVIIRATHTFVGDLAFTLSKTGGPSATVIDRPGRTTSGFGCSGNDIDATLDDEASDPVENECEPAVPTIAGTFTPNNPLSVFDGQSLAGTWRMTVQDFAGGDTGTLVEWCLAPAEGLSSAIFSDGFESGDSSAWSATVP
jgi:extracellular elastinolytic metalloproteinase